MSWKISYTLTRVELNKLNGHEMETEILSNADLMEEFAELTVNLKPQITVECTDCGYVAPVEFETNGLNLTEAYATDLQCDCLPQVSEHEEWREDDNRQRLRGVA